MSDILQILSGAGIIGGIYFYGWQWRAGPLISCVSCLLCIIITVQANLPWLALLNVVLAGMHFINLMKWSKKP